MPDPSLQPRRSESRDAGADRRYAVGVDEPAARKSSFAAVVDSATRLLVLGSLPGEVSLRAAQYYAHPQNQFWRLMGAVIGVDLAAAPYDTRLALLRSRGVGLWDVVRSASRKGSLDTAIRDHQPNALAELAATLPALRGIAFNGATASKIGREALGPDPGWALVSLPSSSAAHTLRFEAKLAQWMTLKPFLAPGSSPIR
jgi:TDG/mug DNA glycosylase family protein